MSKVTDAISGIAGDYMYEPFDDTTVMDIKGRVKHYFNDQEIDFDVKVTLADDPGKISVQLIFESSADQTMFMLKWS